MITYREIIDRPIICALLYSLCLADVGSEYNQNRNIIKTHEINIAITTAVHTSTHISYFIPDQCTCTQDVFHAEGRSFEQVSHRGNSLTSEFHTYLQLTSLSTGIAWWCLKMYFEVLNITNEWRRFFFSRTKFTANKPLPRRCLSPWCYVV